MNRAVRSLPSTFVVLSLALITNFVQAQTFLDDFDRPDNAAIGGGWIEKQAGAFDLVNGEVVKRAVGTSYTDNIVYRPAGEDVLDVEAAVDVLLNSTNNFYPQVHVRISSATVTIPWELDSYILYFDNSADRAVLGRQRGAAFVTTLAELNLNTPLNTTDRYRMRLRAEGVDPVQLGAWVERWNGSGWDVLASATASDASANRHDTAGSVGFSGYIASSFAYDNFTRTELGGGGGTGNPVPSVSSADPNQVIAGSGGFTLTVQGADFLADSTVRWDGVDRPTTFVSATTLQAAISAGDVAAPGTADVTVFNPLPGGGESNSTAVLITDPATNPVPTVVNLTPSTAIVGGSAFSMTVQGTGFVPGAVARWAGADRTTTYVSDTQLLVAVDQNDLATSGQYAVTVFNPVPGGGLSNSATFTVTDPAGNPEPAITLLNPNSAFAGGSDFLITVEGTGFVPESTVTWNGANRATTFVSSTILQATIRSTDIRRAGTEEVRVSTPAPGGGVSDPLTFTVLSPGGGGGPQDLTAISPLSAVEGSSGITLTVSGSGFTESSVVRLSGTDLPTTFVSPVELSATIASNLLNNVSRPAIVVSTPDAANPLSLPLTFFVLEAGEQVFFDGFNRPDSETIGNGWTEKMDSAFRIQNGEVPSTDTSPIAWTDTILSRPQAEDALDVEVGVEFRRNPGDNTFYPQIHARIDRDTISEPGWLESYTLFYDDGWGPVPAITITPIEGWGECYIAHWPMSEPFIEGDRYRLRFIIRGSNPVVLTGYLDHLVGDSWDQVVTGTVSHRASTQPDPSLYCNIPQMIQPHTQAGGVGLAKWRDPTDQYDNFYVVSLASAPNPDPTTTDLTPDSVAAGSPGFTLTIEGSDFSQNAVARWNGNDLPTTRISSTEVRATVSSALVAMAGSATITVFNPAPGGGESNAQTFTIDVVTNPTPAITFVSPGATFLNAGPLPITVGGLDFVPASVVRFDGTDLATTFESSTTLTAVIPASELTATGTFQVTVFSPGPGGGTSNSLLFSVTDSPPGLFLDTFDRADSATLGNGWIEKTPEAFSLAGLEVEKAMVWSEYLDNLVYRPAGEDILDVEASIELTFNGNGFGYPQIITRLQSATAGNAGVMDGYLMYVNDSATNVNISRNRGSDYDWWLATINLTTPLNAADRFRLRLRTVGTNPVQLTGYVEVLTAEGWEIIGQGSAADTSNQRLSTPGSVGFGGHIAPSYNYDNFRRTPQ